MLEEPRSLTLKITNTWSTRMKSYLQGQNLWDVIEGTELNPPDSVTAMKKWNIKVVKVMFAIKTTVDKEMLEHISIIETSFQKHEIRCLTFLKEERCDIAVFRERALVNCSKGDDYQPIFYQGKNTIS